MNLPHKSASDSIRRRLVAAVARNPVMTCALVGLALAGLVEASGVAYDSGGAKGVLFWLSALLRLPFWAVSEILFALHGGRAFPGMSVLTIGLGLLLSAAFDWGVRRARRRIGR